jgi:hypothetical protein
VEGVSNLAEPVKIHNHSTSGRYAARGEGFAPLETAIDGAPAYGRLLNAFPTAGKSTLISQCDIEIFDTDASLLEAFGDEVFNVRRADGLSFNVVNDASDFCAGVLAARALSANMPVLTNLNTRYFYAGVFGMSPSAGMGWPTPLWGSVARGSAAEIRDLMAQRGGKVVPEDEIQKWIESWRKYQGQYEWAIELREGEFLSDVVSLTPARVWSPRAGANITSVRSWAP